jgi:2-amino-4-hydroxy-6-hydroxymethyldihydropteridine diphosphokinase
MGFIMKFYLSLGSNLGDRIDNLNTAINYLKGFGEITRKSRIYETKPVLMKKGVPDFFNMIVEYSSSLDPNSLLERIKTIERDMGRTGKGKPYLSRPIDIDIVFAGNRIIRDKDLIVPHREMHKRGFVLAPLNDIVPDFIHPVLQLTVKELYYRLENKDDLRPLNVLWKKEEK